MRITSLELKNFRNYPSLELSLHPGTNLFHGDNAQGKTNILEAVYLCGTTKSHRGSKDREMIRFEEEESHIRMQVEKDYISYRIDMHLKKNKPKGIAINGIPIKKARDLFGIVNLVFFSPEDLQIIKSGPGERRRFLDVELCQLDKLYLADLSGYNHILNQRNKLLKDLSYSPRLMDTLEVWDRQLADYGNRLVKKRRKFLLEIQEIIKEIHQNLTGGKEELTLRYEPSAKEEALFSLLEQSREKDLRMKSTSAGPHRDDFCVTVNEVDIRRFGSQGQQRTAALSLKLSEIELVKKRISDTPVLLLDDVLSELDGNRQNYLLACIHDIQTLITCTGLEDFIKNRFGMNRVYEVNQGTVTFAPAGKGLT